MGKNQQKIMENQREEKCALYVVTSGSTCNGAGALWCQFPPQTVRYRPNLSPILI